MYKINTYNSMINSCGHEKPLSHKACANCVLLIKTNLYFSLFFTGNLFQFSVPEHIYILEQECMKSI